MKDFYYGGISLSAQGPDGEAPKSLLPSLLSFKVHIEGFQEGVPNPGNKLPI